MENLLRERVVLIHSGKPEEHYEVSVSGHVRGLGYFRALLYFPDEIVEFSGSFTFQRHKNVHAQRKPERDLAYDRPLISRVQSPATIS